MKQYEYNVLTNRYHVKEEVLNLLGKEGWELISHTYTDKSQSIEDEHIYIFKREEIEVIPSLSDEEVMEMFQKEYESPGWVDPMIEMLEAEEAPAESWMDEYYDDYIKLQASGMMFEFHPTWAGIWDKDKYAFCHDRKFKKK
jgi:hypothetical protein